MAIRVSATNRLTRSWVVGLALVSAAACSAAPPATPTSVPASAASSPTPAPPDKAADLAAAKQALITAHVLGKPWVAAKTVHRTGTEDEACPGQPTTDATVEPLAAAGTQFTAGQQTGAAIAVFRVWTYPDTAAVDSYRDALPKVLTACASYVDSNKMSVVLTPSASSSIDGADETWRYAERIYYDAALTKLAYARHYIIARHGRALSSTQYAFLTDKKDPNAKDFSVAEKMAQEQFDRVVTSFEEH